MQALVRSTGAVVELRSASQLGDAYFASSPEIKYGLTKNMVSRLADAGGARPRVTLLDTGVDHANPLLSPMLHPARCHTVVAGWGTGDHDGHGTKMAGVAQFLDLGPAVSSSSPIPHYTDLETVVVTAPLGSPGVPARWAIEQAVKIVEKDSAPRVFCLAQTARGEANTGRGTATSAAIDLLAYGNGTSPRLFCVAAGNVPMTPSEPYQYEEYADRNARFGIESPGQAFNAITVGGMTNKVAGTAPLVAPSGDMSPTSRSATSWDRPHPGKPDIVLEAGNLEITDSVFAAPSRSNFVLTTAANAATGPLTLTGETSAATARAAGLAGRIMWAFPNYRPETVRGLLVHSAEWTPAMRAELSRLRAESTKSDATQRIFDRYGWGTPNEDRLWASEGNDFTLIIEDELQPYAKPKTSVRINQMKYFKLPWPKDMLKNANLTPAELKCTLSYFIEPDPNAYARGRYDRYASTRLEFDVKQHDEDDEDAQAVFNADSQGNPHRHRYDGWDLGQMALRGSLHQDTWRGPAWALADRDGISVAPAKGWWSDIPSAGRVDQTIRFSLIVSLKVEGDVDLVSEVRSRIASKTLVEAPTAIGT